MRVYKLTDENMRAYGGYQWRIGEWRETSGEGELCGPGWLHCYASPLLAVLLNPIHARIEHPRLFVAETKGRGKHDKGLKSGYKAMRLVREIKLPVFTTTQKVAFGILCAKEVCKDEGWNAWANRWLSGDDRTEESAASAASAAYDAAANDAYDAYALAANAAASYASSAASAASAAYDAAANDAYAAANAAAASSACIDLSALTKKALEY